MQKVAPHVNQLLSSLSTQDLPLSEAALPVFRAVLTAQAYKCAPPVPPARKKLLRMVRIPVLTLVLRDNLRIMESAKLAPRIVNIAHQT